MLTEDLQAARRGAGMTQKALADRLGVSVQTIQRLEQGVGSVTTLIFVMDALSFRLVGLGSGSTMGGQLRSRRLSRGWSLDETARRSGMARGTIASLEGGGGSVASLLNLLAVLAPQVRRRAPERAYWGEGDKIDRDSRFTPAEFMENVYAAFGVVDLDPCAHELSPVVASRRILLSEGGDGLSETWSGRLAYVNPPYSQMLAWLRRAHDQWTAGNVQTVVCLVPARTDSAAFHQTLSVDAHIYLLQGRIRFLDVRGRGQQTPFSLMVLTFGTTAEQRDGFAAAVPGFWLLRSPGR